MIAEGGGPSGSAMEVDGVSAEHPAQRRKVFLGSTALNYRRDHMEVRSPFGAEGLIEDWDAAEQMWGHALK